MTCSLRKITGGLSFEKFFEVICQSSCSTHSCHGGNCGWTEESKANLREMYDETKKAQGYVPKSFATQIGRAVRAQSTKFEW